jgi:SpoIID/LytB domain protein
VGGSSKPTLIETLEAEKKGRIEARDSAGNLLADATGYLGVWPKRRETLTCAPGSGFSRLKGSAAGNPRRMPAYRGLMEFWINPNGRMSLVNRVFIEHYLYGVLAGEISLSVPLEMKKVQAVISRSAAIAKLRHGLHAGWHFDFCDDQHCQVYEGTHREDPDIRRAVDETMGQVCVFRNEIIDAVYSQSCGGITSNNEDGWGGEPVPYMRSRVDSADPRETSDLSGEREVRRWLASRPAVFCSPYQDGYPDYANAYFRWSRTFTARQLLDNFLACGAARGTRLLDLRVGRRATSGRVAEIQIVTDAGSFSVRKGLPIRNALCDLNSTLFLLEPSYDARRRLLTIRIDGAGRGHGVGLCQLGAIMMARRGYNYIQILKHYYQGIDVYKIYK